MKSIDCLIRQQKSVSAFSRVELESRLLLLLRLARAYLHQPIIGNSHESTKWKVPPSPPRGTPGEMEIRQTDRQTDPAGQVFIPIKGVLESLKKDCCRLRDPTSWLPLAAVHATEGKTF